MASHMLQMALRIRFSTCSLVLLFEISYSFFKGYLMTNENFTSRGAAEVKFHLILSIFIACFVSWHGEYRYLIRTVLLSASWFFVENPPFYL